MLRCNNVILQCLHTYQHWHHYSTHTSALHHGDAVIALIYVVTKQCSEKTLPHCSANIPQLDIMQQVTSTQSQARLHQALAFNSTSDQLFLRRSTTMIRC
mmetsp:Transcript_12556/g.27088  ORF Transcript_12556/g.27088 Transcript_12556/m.27088 type:complete len:100 (+) Transcript_12556:2636-2935(+)